MTREIHSPSNGLIKEIFVQTNDFVYEWENLIIIENKEGDLVPVQLSSSGYIESLNVDKNRFIMKDTIIGYLVEDLLPCGSD
ncbi:hypothetical protein RYX56_18260 [Alkalihalophilus lindianensis]|uniref:Uncharacterized protein n=1 Tax=Alkalihalophilus lindianensis TaxID=1630542 RepID=A0ABU3XEK1_9BACI|nr:hypothetical protein [Alkalihalophilus lindianensis]MDV2686315.1 hypothetical protein [Alkalihalophilus lindianensis]